jgi:hypothetical protein
MTRPVKQPVAMALAARIALAVGPLNRTGCRCNLEITCTRIRMGWLQDAKHRLNLNFRFHDIEARSQHRYTASIDPIRLM